MISDFGFRVADFFVEPLRYEFLQRALLGCVLMGFANGFLSAYVVLRRLSLVADALSHSLLPGLALGAIFFGLAPLGLFLGGLTAAIFVALGGLLISRSSRLSDETGIAALFVVAFATGFLLLNYATQHGLVRVDLTHFLFGNILGLSNADLWLTYVISLVAVVTLVVLHRPLLVALFEPSVARSQGVPVAVLNYVLLGLIVCAMIASLQAVGVVLSLGMLILPGATVYLWSDSFDRIPWYSAALGLGGSVVGLWISYWMNQPSGPCIVLTLGAGFVLSYLLSPKYGALAKFWRRRHLHGESLARWKESGGDKSSESVPHSHS
jgi:ABC-type Mn2+/Zn2+ transport system permease subunit